MKQAPCAAQFGLRDPRFAHRGLRFASPLLLFALHCLPASAGSLFTSSSAFAFAPSAPSNLLRQGEGVLGLGTGWLNERLSVSGNFGAGAARTRYPVEAMLISGQGGYGFTEQLDGYIKIGGTLSPSIVDNDRATGLLAAAGMRYSLAGSRSAELGLFTEVAYLTALENDASITLGNVRAPGRFELRDMVGLTLGLGPQWWWQIGARKFLFPGFYAYVSPRLVGDAFFTQARITGEGDPLEQKLTDVEAQARQLVGGGASVGLDIRVLILRAAVNWFGAFGGMLHVDVPF